MRLTKEEFVEAVNKYKQMLEEENEVMKVFDIMNPEWIGGRWINEYYNLLSKMCELEKDELFGTDLDWFCYETEFGENEELTKVYDGVTEWNITSPEILYDFIMYKKERPFQQKERILSLFLI